MFIDEPFEARRREDLALAIMASVHVNMPHPITHNINFFASTSLGLHKSEYIYPTQNLIIGKPEDIDAHLKPVSIVLHNTASIKDDYLLAASVSNPPLSEILSTCILNDNYSPPIIIQDHQQLIINVEPHQAHHSNTNPLNKIKINNEPTEDVIQIIEELDNAAQATIEDELKPELIISHYTALAPIATSFEEKSDINIKSQEQPMNESRPLESGVAFARSLIQDEPELELMVTSGNTLVKYHSFDWKQPHAAASDHKALVAYAPFMQTPPLFSAHQFHYTPSATPHNALMPYVKPYEWGSDINTEDQEQLTPLTSAIKTEKTPELVSAQTPYNKDEAEISTTLSTPLINNLLLPASFAAVLGGGYLLYSRKYSSENKQTLSDGIKHLAAASQKAISNSVQSSIEAVSGLINWFKPQIDNIMPAGNHCLSTSVPLSIGLRLEDETLEEVIDDLDVQEVVMLEDLESEMIVINFHEINSDRDVSFHDSYSTSVPLSMGLRLAELMLEDLESEMIVINFHEINSDRDVSFHDSYSTSVPLSMGLRLEDEVLEEIMDELEVQNVVLDTLAELSYEAMLNALPNNDIFEYDTDTDDELKPFTPNPATPLPVNDYEDIDNDNDHVIAALREYLLQIDREICEFLSSNSIYKTNTPDSLSSELDDEQIYTLGHEMESDELNELRDNCKGNLVRDMNEGTHGFYDFDTSNYGYAEDESTEYDDETDIIRAKNHIDTLSSYGQLERLPPYRSEAINNILESTSAQLAALIEESTHRNEIISNMVSSLTTQYNPQEDSWLQPQSISPQEYDALQIWYNERTNSESRLSWLYSRIAAEAEEICTQVDQLSSSLLHEATTETEENATHPTCGSDSDGEDINYINQSCLKTDGISWGL